MFGNNGREFALSLPKQPKCKVNRCRFHFLKMDCRCHNSFFSVDCWFFLRGQSPESFRRHVAYRFYPLEGLNIATCYHANNFQRENTVEINRSGDEGKGRCERPPPLPSVLFTLKSLLILPLMIKITIITGLRLGYQPLFGKMSPHSSPRRGGSRPDPGDGGNRAYTGLP